MKRVPEPELMEGEAQAKAYAEADFNEPNTRFLELFMQYFPDVSGQRAVLDLGCGPGDIALRFARAWGGFEVHGLDGSKAMLDIARGTLFDEPRLASRVQFVHGILPDAELPREQYDIVISNSLLHHLHDPQVLWSTVLRYAGPRAPVMVMDLMRPASAAAARAVVETYAADEPELLQTDFFNSLCAAFEPGEVRRQLEDAGLGTFVVEEVTDRHLLVWGWR